MWALRKHIHSAKKHQHRLSPNTVTFLPPSLNSNSPQTLCHAWLPNIYVRYFPRTTFNVSAPRAAENKHIHSPPKSPPNIDPLRIVSRWLPLNITKPTIVLYLLYECIFIVFFLLTSPVMIGSAFSQSDKSTQPEENPTEALVTAKKKKSPYLCFCGNPSDIILQTWGDFVNIPE